MNKEVNVIEEIKYQNEIEQALKLSMEQNGEGEVVAVAEESAVDESEDWLGLNETLEESKRYVFMGGTKISNISGERRVQ